MSEPLSQREHELEQAYLELLKRTLTGTAHSDFLEVVDFRSRRNRVIFSPVKTALDRVGFVLARRGDPGKAEEGRLWPIHAETMIGLKRLNNLQDCIDDVLANDVPGDLIEAGVWRGGTTIFMRALLRVRGDTTRTVWVADSFEGLPRPRPDVYPADEGDQHHTRPSLAVGLEEVRAAFERYGLLDNQVRFLEGWFSDTLPSAPIERLAVMRLDGDMYESTMDALEALYDRLSPGGYVIIDDYVLAGCRAAVDEFRARREIDEPLTVVDWAGVSWRKAPGS